MSLFIYCVEQGLQIPVLLMEKRVRAICTWRLDIVQDEKGCALGKGGRCKSTKNISCPKDRLGWLRETQVLFKIDRSGLKACLRNNCKPITLQMAADRAHSDSRSSKKHTHTHRKFSQPSPHSAVCVGFHVPLAGPWEMP